jgi:predicted RNase H-like HicB family nuclease
MIQVAVCGFKAKCDCPGVWGLGETEEEARESLKRLKKEVVK